MSATLTELLWDPESHPRLAGLTHGRRAWAFTVARRDTAGRRALLMIGAVVALWATARRESCVLESV